MQNLPKMHDTSNRLELGDDDILRIRHVEADWKEPFHIITWWPVTMPWETYVKQHGGEPSARAHLEIPLTYEPGVGQYRQGPQYFTIDTSHSPCQERVRVARPAHGKHLVWTRGDWRRPERFPFGGEAPMHNGKNKGRR